MQYLSENANSCYCCFPAVCCVRQVFLVDRGSWERRGATAAIGIASPCCAGFGDAKTPMSDRYRGARWPALCLAAPEHARPSKVQISDSL